MQRLHAQDVRMGGMLQAKADMQDPLNQQALEELKRLQSPYLNWAGKAERTRFHAGASNHAMVFMGVDLRDGEPRKWLVENSWGGDVGKSGTWTMRNDWFDEHVYTIIVHRSHVPAETLARFDEAATPLPAWYPGAAGIPGK